MGAVRAGRRGLDVLQLQPGAGARGDPGVVGRWPRPSSIVAARFAAVDAAFRRLLGDEVRRFRRDARAAGLARRGGRGGGPAGGGPALGGGARRRAVAAPNRTWCCGTRSRSCASTAATDTSRCSWCTGCRALEALVTHAASGDVPAGVAAFDPWLARDAWDAAVDVAARSRLARAGRRAPSHRLGRRPAPSDRGRDRRPGRGALPVLGEEGCAELRALAVPGASSSPRRCPVDRFRGDHPHMRAALPGSLERLSGRLAQLVRAAGLQPAGRGFESLSAHLVMSQIFWDR